MANVDVNTVATKVAQSIKGATVTPQSVSKGNGVVLTGLVIKGEKNMAPIIYIDDLIAEGMNEDQIAYDVVKTYYRYKPEDNLDADAMTDWGKVKGSIKAKAVNNTPENTDGRPYRVLEGTDIAIVYYVDLSEGDVAFPEVSGQTPTVNVRDDYMSSLGVTEQDLYEAAIANESVEIDSIGNVLAQIMGTLPASGEEAPMLVVSNDKKLFGAGLLADPEVLTQIADNLGDGYYILPSSIHEFLAVPGEGMDETKLAEMVMEVNSMAVAPEEQLSNNVFKYVGGKLTQVSSAPAPAVLVA